MNGMDKKLDEEFNNFMHKVNEVNSIVQKLNSTDKSVQQLGDFEAKRFLGEADVEEEITNVDDVKLTVKCDRTVLNKKVLHEIETTGDGSTMSQEAFMEEMSRDADKRYQDKLVRREKMETFKKQATKAFRRGEYEKALSLYNKAIEQIKDSCLLYNNRALTFIKLKFYEKAIPDLEVALRLNEDCLKTHLLLAKVYFHLEKFAEFNNIIKEAKNRNPEHENFIIDYVNELKKQDPI